MHAYEQKLISFSYWAEVTLLNKCKDFFKALQTNFLNSKDKKLEMT